MARARISHVRSDAVKAEAESLMTLDPQMIFNSRLLKDPLRDPTRQQPNNSHSEQRSYFRHHRHHGISTEQPILRYLLVLNQTCPGLQYAAIDGLYRSMQNQANFRCTQVPGPASGSSRLLGATISLLRI